MSTPDRSACIPLPPELHGDRILLRPYRADDADAVFAAIEESREHLRPWVGWVDRFTTADETRDYCVRCADSWLARSDLFFGIFDIANGLYLGGAGLHTPNWEKRAFEISCWIRTTAAYQGYGTESLNLLAGLGFGSLQARQIKLVCDARNGPTQTMAEKCGYVLRGRVRDGYAAPDGMLVDRLIYSLTPEDWSHRGSETRFA